VAAVSAAVSRQVATRVLLAGGALIAAVWALAPAPSPPLYDGLSGPAEAYRYLNPPQGAQQTQPPSSATKTLSLTGGRTGAGFLTTEEQSPQAQFLVAEGSFLVPPGTKSVTVTIKPVPPRSPLPSDLGRLDGNVYSITASADVPGTVTLSKSITAPTVVLRGPPGSTAATVVRLGAEGTWTKLHTVPLGGQVPDMVAANTDQLGDFSLALGAGQGSSGSSSSASQSGSGSGSGGGFPVLAVAIPLGAVVLAAGLILLVRRSRATGRR
jgi:hypothetical protein